MKRLLIALVIAGLTTTAVAAQGLEDVPPWHWARAAIDRLVSGGIIVGFPPNHRDLAANAVIQIYEAFSHPSHPEAQAWAERFLADLPAAWPRPLQQSPLLRYRLEQFSVRFGLQGMARVSFVAFTVVRNGAAVTQRASVQAEAQQDPTGRWRVNYASLAAAQPQVFR